MIELAHRPAAIRVAIACIAFVLFSGVVAVATYDSGLPIGDARLHTDGVANVVSPNGQQRAVHGTVRLHNGDVVEAAEGSMNIDLPDGSSVEGRPGQDGAQNTRVHITHPVELVAGDLLVTASKGTDVDASGNRVHLEKAADGVSAARVSRSLVVGAAVYRGQVTLDSAGQRRTITALRELDVTSLGRPSSDLRPVKPRDDDSWDRRFLGEAMDLTVTLNRYATSYSPSLPPGAGRTVAFYEQLLPALATQTDFSPALISDARASDPGDTLIGAAIATLGQRASFAQRWNDTFAFHDQGAGWGLVALDQGVASGPLLAAVRGALDVTPFQFAAANAVGATTPTTGSGAGPVGGSTSSNSSPASSTSPTTASPTTTTLPPTTTPSLPPPTTTPPPTSSPLVDGLVNDVNNLLGGVTSSLN